MAKRPPRPRLTTRAEPITSGTFDGSPPPPDGGGGPFLRPTEIRNATFKRVRKGYDPDQVRQVLGFAADALAGRIKFNPDHVRTAVFKVVANGYDQKQVDELLALLEHQLRNRIVPPTGLDTGTKLLAVKLPRATNGYDRGEVDAFLQRAAANLDGRGTMTANEIRNTRFSTTSGLLNRGYDVRSVDELLDDLEQELRLRGR